MALNLVNLDDTTRKQMLDEIRSDISSKRLYISPRLSFIGQKDYPGLLQDAAAKFDDAWLANQLRTMGRLNATEQRKTKNGFTTAQVPITAADTLAEGEFNRYYMRALCVRAGQDNCSLIVYRAKSVSNPRAESEAKIGTLVNPASLVSDLRTHIGVDTALGLPAGPNSGLSIKMV